MLVIFKLPVDTIEPLVKIDPVNTIVSAFATNKAVPALPVNDRDPDIDTS